MTDFLDRYMTANAYGREIIVNEMDTEISRLRAEIARLRAELQVEIELRTGQYRDFTSLDEMLETGARGRETG